MLESIHQANELKKELDELRPLSKEQELRIQLKFKLDWNYHSNHLEGNSLTYGETKALILHNITAQGKPLKDHIEMTGHNEAVKWIFDVVKNEFPLTENFIRELHSLLLKESYYVDAITPEGNPTRKKIEIGKYKSIPNHVKTITGEIFRFATPEETPAMMNDLIAWYNEKKKDKEAHPILTATEFHYKFIRIHPFDDGNGRTARILMNFILMQYGFPPVVIKTEDKQTYFSVLRLADAGDIQPFVKFISENLIHSLQLMINGAKGEEIEEEDDLDKEINLIKLKIQNKNSNNISKYELNKNVYIKDCFQIVKLLLNNNNKFFEMYEMIETNIIFNNQYNVLFQGFISSLNIMKLEYNQIINKLNGSDIEKIDISTKYLRPKYNTNKIGYEYSITISMNELQISISNQNTVYYSKNIDNIISSEEIQKIVTAETKKHIEFINNTLNT